MSTGMGLLQGLFSGGKLAAKNDRN